MAAATPGLGPPSRIIDVEETASSNQLALDLAAEGERGTLWVTARRQTVGRGRSGRSWASLDGNLHATLLLRPGCAVATAAELALVAGVAVIDAIRHAAGGSPVAGLRVKWPNDILIEDAKLGGILIESSTRAAPQADLVVAVGIGLNLVACPEHRERRLTHLAAHGVQVTRESMLAHLDTQMACWLERWDTGRGFSTIRVAWLERAGPTGERISVNAGGGPVEGRFLGLDATGALMIADAAGRERRFTFGDVTLLGEGQGGDWPRDRGATGAGR